MSARPVTDRRPHLRVVEPADPRSWSDEDLQRLAARDRAAAMDAVVRKYRDRLYYHALYIVKNAEEAYDAVQEVFIRAIRERRFFDEGFRMKAWLFRVTTNLCFNIVRDKKRRGAILDASLRPSPNPADQVERVFEGERRREVLAAIDQMTDDHREILLLRYYDDLSYAEIAEVLGIKLGTVMSRLSRARARLLKVMEDNEEVRP